MITRQVRARARRGAMTFAASGNPAVLRSLTVVDPLVPLNDEVSLMPRCGLARWLPPPLFRWAFALISMRELPRQLMMGRLTANEGYFRRDRHVRPLVDRASYALKVEGVARPRTFALDDLAALPQNECICVMECAGNGNHWMGSAGLLGQARWRGVLFEDLLAACGGPGQATHFACFGLDRLPVIRPRGYHYGLSLDELLKSRALLALTMNGEALPRARGFPVRLVVPGVYSMSHVKWLDSIVGNDRPHDGFWNVVNFTNKRKNNGQWVREQARWIGLKSLITRCLRQGDRYLLHGWAWGGNAPLARVEVTCDGGKVWHEAELTPASSLFQDMPEFAADAVSRAWSTFHYVWQPPRAGRYCVGARAHSVDGTSQPLARSTEVVGHFNQTQVKWRDVVIPVSPK